MPLHAVDGKSPSLAEDVFVAPNANVSGDVTMGPRSSVWFSSVIRADGAPIALGQETDVQDNSAVTSLPGQPCSLGDQTAMGHGAQVHASRVGSHVLIAMNATVMPGCTIGDGCIIAANAVVPPGSVIPPNSLVIGTEGRVAREVRPNELERIRTTVANYVKLSVEHRQGIGRGW